jgi:hypothetical protein
MQSTSTKKLAKLGRAIGELLFNNISHTLQAILFLGAHSNIQVSELCSPSTKPFCYERQEANASTAVHLGSVQKRLTARAKYIITCTSAITPEHMAHVHTDKMGND